MAPLAFGLVLTDQVVPFHASMRVLDSSAPTATQKVDEVQLTPARLAEPVRVGLVITVHAVPFHSSISGDGPVPCCPTATQKLALAQESARRTALSTPLGVVATVQFDALTVAGTVIGVSGVVAPAAETPDTRDATKRPRRPTVSARAEVTRRIRVNTAPLHSVAVDVLQLQRRESTAVPPPGTLPCAPAESIDDRAHKAQWPDQSNRSGSLRQISSHKGWNDSHPP